MRYGYIRVSTDKQDVQRQIDQLESSCDQLFIETISATSKKRPEFTKLKRKLKSGDRMVVLDLDRAFRSSVEALQTEQMLRDKGITFEIISLCIDNSTPEGELMFTVLAAFAHYERRCLSRRTAQGMASAKARGIKLGRPYRLSNDDILEAKTMLDAGSTPDDVAKHFGCARQTVLSSVERFR